MEALYDALADLWIYPDDGLEGRVTRARAALDHEDKALAEQLEALHDFVDASPLEEVEELYTRTFDINPVCTLECGWHLYGEDYARGAFLVRMRGLMRDLGVEESVELPDHLTHVLPVLGRLPRGEGDTFAGDLLGPALEKMLAGFKDPDNPYRKALNAVAQLVQGRATPTAGAGATTDGPSSGVGPSCGDSGQGRR